MLSKIQMMKLCAIAHSKAKELADQVSAYDPDLSVVWGPGVKTRALGIPYCSAFITKSASTGNYTVAIRGTAILSEKAWVQEDFDIGKTVPFSSFVSSAPPAAVLSQGTANGLGYLLELVPEAGCAGQGTMVDFLRAQKDLKSIAVTGHSLGGTLTGPLFAKLKAEMGAGLSMDLMSFAALTPGNQAFADYLDSLTPRSGWRVVNPLDVAPHFFASREAVLGIYDSEKIAPGALEVALVNKRFDAAATTFVQPGGAASVLPRVFHKLAPTWVLQLVSQHRFKIYLKLVEQEASEG